MSKTNLKAFDYEKVAKLDTAMWQSYRSSDSKFLLLFPQAFILIKYQLRFSWLATFKLAYYAGRAAFAYRLRKSNENYTLAEKNLVKLFQTVSINCMTPFDFKKAAKLELEWWDIERYPEQHTKTLSQTMNENMATVYGVSPSTIEGYGLNRARAIRLLERRELTKTNVKMASSLLTEAWQALHKGLSN
jgi:hypothetical protein